MNLVTVSRKVWDEAKLQHLVAAAQRALWRDAPRCRWCEAERSLRPSGVTRRHGVLIGVKIGNLITFEQQQQQRRST